MFDRFSDQFQVCIRQERNAFHAVYAVDEGEDPLHGQILDLVGCEERGGDREQGYLPSV